ncbi:MAG TPA: phosphopantetheine-binding protein, partial [Thermoanaerobaculia bacterium]|nr:phosphopantetheine-binding protein [Thermoanaerobaculia bacterium]
ELSDPRRILAAIESRRRPRVQDQSPYEPPVTPIEEILADIWAHLLGAERVGRQDNFFRLGGHSLLGTLLMARIQRELGVELPLLTLFQRPTLELLTEAVSDALIESLDEAELAGSLEELSRGGEDGIRRALEAERDLLLGEDARR